MHEIITLQLGRQSSYVASHFWNAQESYFTYGQDDPSPVDHDIHWRAGLGADGSETYLPRTVIYDRKGGFGSLRKVNALYEIQEEENGTADEQRRAAAMNLWSTSNQPVVHRAAPIPPSAYTQSLDSGATPAKLTSSDVRYWSDYSRVYYHPRSLIEVGDDPELPMTTEDSGGHPAQSLSWFDGESLFSSLDREHDLLDRDLRPFAEEADHMQGIQVLSSVDDSWGGFTARYLERMRDEYGKLTIWLWALQEPVGRLPREKRIQRLANKARTLAEAYSQASLVIPVALPSHLPLRTVSGLETSSAWHTSALLATALETITLPTRLRAGQGGGNLTYVTELLNATGKQSVANLQMSVVQPWKEIKKKNKERHDEDDDNADGGPSEIRLDINFASHDETGGYQMNGSGSRSKKARMFGQAVVTRNSDDDEATNGDDDDDDEDTDSRVDPTHISDPQDIARRRFALKPVSQRYDVDLAFPLLDSFPHIYQTTPANRPSIPVTAALATDSAVADRLKSLRTLIPRAIGIEDRESLGNDLASMADAYHDGWSSGSDDDYDDD